MCTPRERIANAFGWCFSGIFLIILLKALGNDIGVELRWPLMAHCLLRCQIKVNVSVEIAMVHLKDEIQMPKIRLCHMMYTTYSQKTIIFSGSWVRAGGCMTNQRVMNKVVILVHIVEKLSC